ncbi:TlpA family protein disulfide reductase [Sulfurimonas sp. MAG313]|nr:TlpA disulfide reductase family protein [Sulfurimonas sp. MAG313]MDF1880781.1 TlpA family protein disulfide reductase [Sulfurimonas sp. MAG313]
MFNVKIIVITSLLVCVSAFGSPKIGDKAVSFDFPELISAKSHIKMRDYNDKVVLLNIWASWCKGCKKEMPFFHKIGKKYKKNGLIVIAVNIDNKAKKANAFLKKLNEKIGEKAQITFAYDNKKVLPKAYGASVVPFSLLIKNGKIVETYYGSFNKENSHSLLQNIKAAIK